MNADAFCRTLRPRFATVGGVRTHFVECGTGPALVLIHGLSASFWNWWRNLEALSRHFHVIAYDLKGCGQSAKPRGEYSPRACVPQLLGLLDHLGVDQAALVAHSMGTRIALTTAIEHSARVRALVLTSPSCYPQTAGRAVHLLVLPGIGELYTQLMFTGRTTDLVGRALRFCMHPNVAVGDEDVYWNMLSGHQKRRLAHAYLRFGRHMRFHKPWPLTKRCSEIPIQTLIISGEHDRFVPTSHPRQLAQSLPSARLELWADTGHLAHTEHPERFNTAVIAFLKQQPARRRLRQAWRPQFERL